MLSVNKSGQHYFVTQDWIKFSKPTFDAESKSGLIFKIYSVIF